MIHLEFMGSVIEGTMEPYRTGNPYLTFRTQFPIDAGIVMPALNGQPLPPIARVRNKAMGKETSVVSEYEVAEPGDLVIVSHMSLTSVGRTFRLFLGVQEGRVLLIEESPNGYPWFIDGDFVEPDETGTHALFCPRYEPEARPDVRVRRWLDDDPF